jgi:hypothetical protein
VFDISLDELSRNSTNIFSPNDLPLSYYPWRVEIQGTKTYHIWGPDCPITDAEFEVTLSGMGKASLNFAILDVPIWSNDIVKIYRNGVVRYQGYVDRLPDLEGGKVSISPFSVKLKNFLYSTDYSGGSVTYKQIVEDVISKYNSETFIEYNETLIALTSTQLFSVGPAYASETINNILKDINDQVDNRYDGVDANNFYYIKQLSTTVTQTIYVDDNPPYQSLKFKVDEKKIKATEYDVYQKSTTTNELEFLGTVGDSTNVDFPALETVVNRIGTIQAKFQAPTGLSSSEALNFAYQKLKAKAVIPENIKVKGMDINRYDLAIGDRVKIYKQEALLWHEVISCQSTSFWNNATLSTESKIDVSSIQIDKDSTTYYDFLQTKRWHGQQKFGFYVKANTQGNVLSYSLVGFEASTDAELNAYGADVYSHDEYSGVNPTVASTLYCPYIKTVNTWQWIDIPTTFNTWQRLEFYTNDTSANVYIDSIKLFQTARESYEGNVINLSYDLSNDLVDVEIGEFFEFADDDFFILQKEVEKIKETQQA